jgi:hypothetical protein
LNKKIVYGIVFLIIILVIGVVAVIFLTKPAPALTFSASLRGDNEVPPSGSSATGQANFTLSMDEMTLSYKIEASNLHNITMAHIHIAAAGANGPIAVWLYPSAPPATLISGVFNGVLAEDDFAAADLLGPLEGLTLRDLFDEIDAGNAYVNIHTSQFPGGEIRGQISKQG